MMACSRLKVGISKYSRTYFGRYRGQAAKEYLYTYQHCLYHPFILHGVMQAVCVI